MFANLTGKQVLVLEPEPIVCLNLVLALEQIEATVLAAQTVSRAHELLELRRMAAAVINGDALDDVKPLCALLRERRIPFILHGCSEAVDLGAARVMSKPALATTVAAAVAFALQGRNVRGTRAGGLQRSPRAATAAQPVAEY